MLLLTLLGLPPCMQAGAPYTWFVDCCANSFTACTSYISTLLPTVQTVAGTSYVSAYADGPISTAKFHTITGLVSSTDGTKLFVSDYGNQR